MDGAAVLFSYRGNPAHPLFTLDAVPLWAEQRTDLEGAYFGKDESPIYFLCPMSIQSPFPEGPGRELYTALMKTLETPENFTLTPMEQ